MLSGEPSVGIHQPPDQFHPSVAVRQRVLAQNTANVVCERPIVCAVEFCFIVGLVSAARFKEAGVAPIRFFGEAHVGTGVDFGDKGL